jgi:hypothetical protein
MSVANAVAIAASDATTKAGTAYTNAAAYADTKAATAYANAVANAASLYQTTAGLSANVATLSANMATYLGNSATTGANVASWITGNSATAYSNATSYAATIAGTAYANAVANAAALYQTTSGLAANVATLTSNNATYFNTVSSVTYAESLRSNRALTGGGTIAVDGSGNIYWSVRFIVMSNGRGTNFSTNGYFNIDCPTSGTITGAGGAGNVTATAAGIPLATWQSLYYILPIGSLSSSVPANFRVVSYGSDDDIPHNWVLICAYNNENGVRYFNNGIALRTGTSYDTAVWSSIVVPTANNSTNLGGSSLATVQGQITGNAATAYTNATSYAATIAGTAYTNATSFATTIAGTAYSNAVANSAVDATTKAGTAYTNAVAQATTLSNNAYTNAVGQATTLSSAAYTNAVAQATTLASAAYTNAIAYSSSNASGAAGVAYTNAIAVAANATNLTSGMIQWAGSQGSNYIIDINSGYYILEFNSVATFGNNAKALSSSGYNLLTFISEV